MSKAVDVHWHEGLFLQPHHLQLLQRGVGERFAGERRLSNPFAYGVIETALSADELANHRVSFDTLHAIMPSGIEVDVPGSADLPALSIKRAFDASTEPLTVYLAVPLYAQAAANVIDSSNESDWRVKRRFTVHEIESPDENTGENPQAVRIRRVNARLVLEGDDTTDLELLPVLRVVHGVGEQAGMPRQDPEFIAPCFSVGGSAVLRQLGRDIANLVEANRKEMVAQNVQSGLRVENLRGDQLVQLLRLHTLSRASARLGQLVSVVGVTPFTLYLELRELLGELCALTPERDDFVVADYNHDNPQPCFRDVANRVRSLLQGQVVERFVKVDFKKEAEVFAAALNQEHFEAPSEYFLAIRTRKDPKALVALVENPDQFKLMPRSMEKTAVFGLPLAVEHAPPPMLPLQTGLHYFRLDVTERKRIWNAMKKEQSMAVVGPMAEMSDFEMALYMILPETGDAK